IDIAEGRKPEQRNDTGLEEEEKEEGSEESPTGATAPISRCPRCDFEIRATPRPPAKEDKMTYVAAILGSKPFRKIYNLYGGK
ncbi:MAG: hypothetical protein GTN93_23185, partial [Anaerolineae bacterium]|nr:hypothetical protein [Anaerolineae bacterium]NIQ80944.1 hypothetical protein [Anaerolineae bacterium]